MEDQFDLELGEDAFEHTASRIEPVISRSTLEAIDGSRRATSSVTTARSDCPASRVMRPWPISPPAPVMSTTGLRTPGIILKPHADSDRLVMFAGGIARRNSRRSLHEDDARRLRPHRRAGSPARRWRSIASSTTAPWAGSRTQLIDGTNLGTYLFEVRARTGRVIYSRGFASIYGEWETTSEVKTVHRSFHES